MIKPSQVRPVSWRAMIVSTQTALEIFHFEVRIVLTILPAENNLKKLEIYLHIVYLVYRQS